MERTVGCRINLDVTEPAEMVFAIAVAARYLPLDERLTFSSNGETIAPEELRDPQGSRFHRVRVGTGELVVEYDAVVDGAAPEGEATPIDLLTYLRPSRYAESDSLSPTALATFGGISDQRELLHAVSSWVGTQLSYVSGSSLPTDGAVRTLLARRGVCRDYSHLCVALLRALGVPARVTSVYAPGLSPMDFHAVAEAWVEGRWNVVDATTLAPRPTLVGIATGRDAADTAFLTTTAGRTDLRSVTVHAVADRLPSDDLRQFVVIG